MLTVTAEVIGRKVVRGVVVEVINKPSVAEGTVCNVGNIELLGGIDQVICFVHSLEG